MQERFVNAEVQGQFFDRSDRVLCVQYEDPTEPADSLTALGRRAMMQALAIGDIDLALQLGKVSGLGREEQHIAVLRALGDDFASARPTLADALRGKFKFVEGDDAIIAARSLMAIDRFTKDPERAYDLTVQWQAAAPHLETDQTHLPEFQNSAEVVFSLNLLHFFSRALVSEDTRSRQRGAHRVPSKPFVFSVAEAEHLRKYIQLTRLPVERQKNGIVQAIAECVASTDNPQVNVFSLFANDPHTSQNIMVDVALNLMKRGRAAGILFDRFQRKYGWVVECESAPEFKHGLKEVLLASLDLNLDQWPVVSISGVLNPPPELVRDEEVKSKALEKIGRMFDTDPSQHRIMAYVNAFALSPEQLREKGLHNKAVQQLFDAQRRGTEPNDPSGIVEQRFVQAFALSTEEQREGALRVIAADLRQFNAGTIPRITELMRRYQIPVDCFQRTDMQDAGKVAVVSLLTSAQHDERAIQRCAEWFDISVAEQRSMVIDRISHGMIIHNGLWQFRVYRIQANENDSVRDAVIKYFRYCLMRGDVSNAQLALTITQLPREYARPCIVAELSTIMGTPTPDRPTASRYTLSNARSLLEAFPWIA
ncbi:MAG: hypothetical protein KIH62_002660 [Candidatus Kerfeldbacteria bacterium]|nr:hypothetical protein [Candidatus Kerfeldbacteria bacterium]